jgi:DNA anti-recombination protein RmuC
MTTEERFERIEQFTAGIAEERRKDRQEYKELWRDTQRQIHELALETRLRFDQIADRFDQVANRLDATAEQIDKLATESRAQNKELGERIEGLVSGIGKILSKNEEA